MSRRNDARRERFFHAYDFLSEALEPRVLFSQVDIPVFNTLDTGGGSFRHAIMLANAVSASDEAVIQFKIPGTGVHTINLLSGLPFITAEVDIIGQTDSKGNPMIELNGQNAGKFSDGLFLERNTPGNTQASSISGLIINRFGSAGIDINDGKASIFGCRIGTNAAGTAALPNGQQGILLEGQGSHIGEAAAGPAFQVLISGNKDDGINSTSSNNVIQNCLIGTDVTGTKAIPNSNWGIEDSGGGNQWGQPGAHGGLVVSGNVAGGIHLTGDNDTIENSKIGTDITGNKKLANKNNGVFLDSALFPIVGGFLAGEGNVISGNTFAGVVSTNCLKPEITGNKIGTNTAGTAGLGNGEAGVFMDGVNGAIASNLISGNGFDGVVVEEDAFIANNNTIELNKIGTDVTGKKPIGNKGDGVLLSIGTNNLVFDNVIAFNTLQGEDGYGVDVLGHAAFGNTITRNSIFSNARLGINIGENDGKVLKNDNKDGDTGPNHLQNYPVLTSAKLVSGQVIIKGTLNSTPNSTFRIEFFASAAADPSGFGEGQQFDGTVTVTTNASGNGSFSTNLDPEAGKLIWTATATSAGGDTSEFSKAIKQS